MRARRADSDPSLTGGLGQLVARPTTISLPSSTLAGLVGALLLMACTSVGQGLHCAITHRPLPLGLTYELWFPLPLHLTLVDRAVSKGVRRSDAEAEAGGYYNKNGTAVPPPPPQHGNSAGAWKSSMGEDMEQKKKKSSSSTSSLNSQQSSKLKLSAPPPKGVCVSAYRSQSAVAAGRATASGEPDYDTMPDLWTPSADECPQEQQTKASTQKHTHTHTSTLVPFSLAV